MGADNKAGEASGLRDGMRNLLEQELLGLARVQRSTAKNAANPPPTEAPGAASLDRRLEDDVTRLALRALGVPAERFDTGENLANYGADSIAITELMAQISRFLGVSIAPTTFFEAKHLDELCTILRTRHGAAIARHYAGSAEPVKPVAAPRTAAQASLAVAKAASQAPAIDGWLAGYGVRRVKPAAAALSPTAPVASAPPLPGPAEPVAIIGMAGKFPGSPDLEAFRRHLQQGDDCIVEIPPERWDWRSIWGDPNKGAFCNVKYGGFVDGHDQFDAGFFNISPKEAELMDPQHRLFIECVWQLVESAGYAPTALAGRKLGIFLGINLLDYVGLANAQGLMEAMQMTGLGHVFCPNRLSFLLDVQGPSEVIDTACSSSLVAVHRAIMSIRHEGCEMAIAGGANLMLSPTQHLMFAKVGMLSPDGRCKTFSAAANGYARSEGVGAVLLKRLDLAERDGDQILAVIRGSAENHGGAASSLTAPNPAAQARLIVEAHRQAAIDPRSVTQIECHGTGTRLGDPIELAGLKTAFAELYRERGLPPPGAPHCVLGSVKSNIGHTETAAGVAGLIKLVLAMQDGLCYRSLHCADPNPLLELAGSPFQLASTGQAWQRPVIDGCEQPRRAAISSFGAGGANAHLVLEEYQTPARPAPRLAGAVVLPLSARSETALRAAAEALHAWLTARPPLSAELFAGLAYTLQIGRDAMRYRLACTAGDGAGLADGLAAFLRGEAGAWCVGQVPRDNVAGRELIVPAKLPVNELAARWVSGAQVDWAAAWGSETPRRLALPTYPFQRQRYWLPAAEPLIRQSGLTPRARDDGGFSLDLTGQEFFLADHRVHGVPVLPGVAYLEIVQRVAEARGLKNFCIRQLIWQQPLRVTAPLTLDIGLSVDASGWPRVEIASRDAAGQRQVHAQARLAARESVSASTAESEAMDKAPALSLADLRAAHPQVLGQDEVYRAFAAIGIDYGPAHRALHSLALGRDAQGRPQVLGELSLPDGLLADLPAFVLHPSLLDAAFQATIGMALGDKEKAGDSQKTALPFALDRVEIHAPCTSRMWVRVRAGEAAESSTVRTLDLDLLDASGNLRVSLSGFCTRLLAPSDAAPAAANLLFAATWTPIAQPSVRPGVAENLTVPSFARRLVLLAGASAQRLNALVAALPGHECVILDGVTSGSADDFSLAAGLMLHHVQALLGEAVRPALPVFLQLVLDGPAAASLVGLSGLLKTARLEYPRLCGQVVVVDDGELLPALHAASAIPEQALVRQTSAGLQPVQWQTHWKTLRNLSESETVPRSWRADGVYLITGGAGAIGRLLVCDILAQAPAANIVLTGRSPQPGGDWLADLQANGAAVSYRAVDMADALAVQGLIEAIHQTCGRLHGVFHCAGLCADQALAEKDLASMARVLAPKVSGTIHLDRALGDRELDFLVLFSSLAGVFGNPGQADYAAANAFLDDFAERREQRRIQGVCQGRTLAIAWPLWQDGGMNMAPEMLRLMRQTTGLTPLSSAAALNALAAVLSVTTTDQPVRLLVMAGDETRLQRRIALLNQPEGLPASDTAAASASIPVSAIGRLASVSTEALRAPLLAALTHCASRLLKVAQVDLDADVELAEYGFDSIGFTQFANAVNDQFGLEITPTLFFEYPTLGQLADGLAQGHGDALASRLGILPAAPSPQAETSQGQALVAPIMPWQVEPAVARVATSLHVGEQYRATGERKEGAKGAEQRRGQEPIAIVSLTTRFPKADDPEAFWANLEAGRDCISEIPAERWDWQAWWGDPATQPNRTQIKWGGFIDGMAAFDPAFFGLSGPEARAMDPQQRLLLSEAWHLLERAGHAPRSLYGSRTGVFIGIADTGYGRLSAAAGQGVEGYSMTGLAPSLGPNRISFHFNFHGPSLAVETACSSALVAIHRAVEAIHSGHCDAAIAGGVNALLLPEAFVGFNKAGMLAPDGRCKPFAATANGYARGEGVGLVFLKRLADAERDGDNILGVIRASMENHGGRASSLTAPNPRAQADLLRQAWRKAGVDPRTAGYIEAHGTGTPLGDPIEVEALVAAFADLECEAEAQYGPLPVQPCGIGSVKGNIGHLELAAGIAGLSKVLLQMAHGRLVPTLHCATLNPYLKLAGSRFQVVRESQPWPRPRDAAGRELPRRAGVSSFGFGGSNAHLVLEEYLPPSSLAPVLPSGPAMILLSAKTPERLSISARQLAAALTEDMALPEIAWTLQVGRDAMEHRLAFLANDHRQLRERLLAFADGRAEAAEGFHLGQVKPHRDTLAILDGDEEMRRAVASLPQRGKHDSLLQLWVRGLLVDWRALYPEHSGLRRCILPVYPFATQRYWVDGVASPAPILVADSLAESLVESLADSPRKAPLSVVADVPSAAMPEFAEETPVDRRKQALAAVVQIAAGVLEVEPEVLDADTELGEYGFDSITMTGFATKTNAILGLSLTPADFFEFATLARLAGHIAALPAFGSVQDKKPSLAPSAIPSPAPRTQPASRASAAAQRRILLPSSPDDDDPIAIVGVSCRLPMANDLDAFWQNLLEGRDCISEIPAERWDWREFYGDPKQEPSKTNIRWAGFIDGVFEFDPLFFGISPREAKLMDPQQRLMMMYIWKAIEDAGHAPREWAGRSVGLFVATSSSGYREMIGEDTGGEGYVATGAVPSVGPNRMSYFLDWHGPSEPVETACSSSLVALHRAIQSMRSGDCEMAVVGGVNTIVTPEAHINFAKAGMLSPDGRCQTFSAKANGYVRGEGVGMIVLRRLSDARRDGDPIYAVVRGSAVNHGGRANSLTAPNTAAQSAVLQAAYGRAGVDVASVGYIEAHGTGTPLGDPVEINALKSAFHALGASDAVPATCAIGSVKSNIGHLELAAGMASIIKVLLQMRHRTLVASLHSAEINPYIDLGGSPFFIVRDKQHWPAVLAADGSPLPRRAGISSFGFGGVNAHVVLEEFVQDESLANAASQAASGGEVLVPLSARDDERLREQVGLLLAALATGRYTEADLPDLAWTLQIGREAMKCRLAVVVDSLSSLRSALQGWLDGCSDAVCSSRVEAARGVAAAPASGSWHEIGRQWVRGAEVIWPARPDGRRLSLPSYPFARETYRIGMPGRQVMRTVGLAQTPARTPAQAVMQLASDGAALWRLEATAFYLRDHRVGGVPMLPGAMSVELARMAYTLKQGKSALSMRQVVWLKPVTLDDACAFLRLSLTPAAGGQNFRLCTGEFSDGAVHVQGQVGPLGVAAPAPLLRQQVAEACPRILTPAWLYSRYAALGLDYGPAFRVVSELQAGPDQFLARLTLPAAAVSDTPFVIHPVMLDGAFQACLAFFADASGEAQAALPFVIETLHVHRPTVPQMWVHGRLVAGDGHVRKIDLDLADADGQVCIQVRGFSVRLQAPIERDARREQAMATGGTLAGARRYLAGLIAEEASLAPTAIDPAAALEAYGIDSIMIVRLTDRLEQDFGRLSKTLFFDHQTLDALASYFMTEHAAQLAVVLGDGPDEVLNIPPAGEVALGAAALFPTVANSAAPSTCDGGIAIVGLAGRYPGAGNLDEFWANLVAGRDCVSEVPAARWDHAAYYDSARGVAGKTNSKWGGFIDDVDCFDPQFFNIAPREAGYLDPQERLFLQCAWETLEDAGYTRAALARAETPLSGGSVGVFVGVMYEEYQLYGAESTQRGQPLALSGSAASIANRVSYFCNLHGPSLAVDSMCSSSLTAIHLACESLRAGGCEMALAGGVNLTLHPNKYLALAQGRFTSSKGRCESFGEGGDGYVPGEGVGAVLLKPLARAEADGDRIYGVIRGSALNHGGKTNGYAVPNPHAQEAVIRRAMAKAGVAPCAVSYVEAHGTGTSLGDPIEIAALARAFTAGEGVAAGGCAIGSVKSNIGHAESAAGIAGLTKVLLQMQHGQLVPSLHSERLNPNIDFAATPFIVQRRLQAWPRQQTASGVVPRIAGLSSFGAGGSNAHLVIEEYITSVSRRLPGVAWPGVFPFSARDTARLGELLRRMRQALLGLAETDLPAVARCLQMDREAFEQRVVILAVDRRQLIERIDDQIKLLAAPAISAAIHVATATSSPEGELAARWMAGETVNWLALWPAGPLPPKIGLPTYPFARERYWVPGSTSVAAQREDSTNHLRISLPPAARPTQPPLLFTPEWRPVALLPIEPPASTWVVLCEPGEWLAELSVALAPAEYRILDQRTQSIAQRYTVYAQFLLEMIQDLVKQRPDRALLQVVVPLAGETGLFAGLAGLLRTAGQEHPALRCQLLALDESETDPLGVLRAEQASADLLVRYVGAERQIPVWRELLVSAAESAKKQAGKAPWRDGGVYLITGGAGGLGLLLAEHIASQTQGALLCLVGRSAPSAELQARLAALPAQVIYRAADIADMASAQQVVDELRQIRGPINGIIHAAGITRDKLLLRKNPQELAAVLAPKVAGLYALDQATAACDLDCVILFASLSGALGNPGQADYACANAWLDAFAAYRNRLQAEGRRRGKTLSIDWPYWRDGGMRLDDRQIQAMVAHSGVHPLTTEGAWAALDLAWDHRQVDQVLVLDGDDPDRLRALLGLGVVRSAEALAVPPGLPPGAPDLKACVVHWLAENLAEVTGLTVQGIDPFHAVDRYGLDSVLAMQMIERLERSLGILPKTLLFEYPSVDRLADALLSSHAASLAALLTMPDGQSAEPGAEHALTATEAEPLRPAPVSDKRPVNPDIAVIAVAGRYPGAENIEEFWAALQAGRDCVTEIPAERWDLQDTYSPNKGEPGRSYCKWGGFLENIDCFDPGFFGLSARDAILMDPQERLFLQTVWHLLERGGHTRDWLRQHYDARVGVFVGAMYHPYHAVDTDDESRMLVAQSSHASLANRVSFFFDLQGPSIAVDTMCSSGLQAVHLAVQSLQRGECALAIAGGVNLTLSSSKYIALSRAGMLGSQVDSRSFGDGDGYLPAEGVGAVLLKPMADALRDGDPVIAVIKASSANHAGHSAGYGVPSGDAQARLIEENFRRAAIDPRSVGYVEAAANGSALGDAIEFRALTRAFRAFTADEGFCRIGSVKANLGHGESASGMAQLTKVLLQLEHRQLVPGVLLESLSPHLQFAGSPFLPQRALEPWQASLPSGGPLRATVSSFGAGGANVHLILEAAPELASTLGPEAAPALPESRRAHRFPLFARDPGRLAELLSLMRDYLERHPDVSLARLAATLQYRREPMACAWETVAVDRAELIARLSADVMLDATRDAGLADAVAAADPTLPPLVLPGYPFAREHYWLPRPAQAAIRDSLPAEAVNPVPAKPLDANALLEMILDCMASELCAARASLNKDSTFRQQGADSMLGLRLIYRLAEATSVQLRHADLEKFPTPAALAAEVLRRQGDVAVFVQPNSVATPAVAYPLSEGQKGLWRWQQLYPALTAYNLPLAFCVDGVVLPVLEQTCRAVVAAWPLLASRIVALDDGEPEWQPALTPAMVNVLTLAPEMSLDAAVAARTRLALDLTELPGRFELLRGGSQDVVLILIHHIVFDGLSAVHFSRYFWSCYGRLLAGQPVLAPPHAASFAEFVAWERAYLASQTGLADLAYWQTELGSGSDGGSVGDLPVLDLPRCFGTVQTQPGCGASLSRELPTDLVLACRDCAQALAINPSAFFLGVLHILLYRYTGQEDIVVGMPVVGRPDRRFEQSIGYFANLLAIRAFPRGDMAAGEFLQAMQLRLIEGMDHGAWPFATLPGKMKFANGRTSSDLLSLVQVIFGWQSFIEPQDFSADAGVAVRHISGARQSGDVPLALEFHAEGDQLHLVVAFDEGCFDRDTIERLLGHYQNLAAAICREKQLPIGQLDMLGAAERCCLLDDWSGRNQPLPSTTGSVVEWIVQQASLSPEATALIVGAERLSYGELTERAWRLASYLNTWGVKPGQAVAVLLGRSADSIVALLATLRLGLIWVPLEADCPRQRLALILADAAPVLIIAETASQAQLPLEDVPVVLLDRMHGAIERSPQLIEPPCVTPDSPAYLIYTSGSTGNPKGVAVSHGALAVHCAAVMAHYALSPVDRVLQFASHHVDAALEQIVPTLTVGACLVMRDQQLWSPFALAEVFSSQGVSVADLPPAYLRDVLQAWREEPVTVSCPRLLIAGGEALAPELLDLWRQSPLANARFLNAYGPTEATITATVCDVRAECSGDVVPNSVPIGRPLAGGWVYILDRDGNPVPEGVIGELVIGGPRVAQGYRGQTGEHATLNATRFRPDAFADDGLDQRVYYSGDLARYLPGAQGLIAFHGRRDLQVKIRGFRIEPGEVETLLRQAGAVDAVVMARTGSGADPSLIAYVVANGQPDEAGFRRWLAERLPAAMCPASYVFLARLPMTQGGKIDRQALPLPPLPGAAQERAVQDEVELALGEFWCRLLGLSSVTAADDFFLCGGHSLLVLQLLGLIRRHFGRSLSMSALLAAPTLGQQAALLRQDAGVAESSPLVLLHSGGRAAPVFFMHPVGGGVGCYRELASRLAGDRPVYGLQSPALDGSLATGSLPEMAAVLLGALRSVQSRGPYFLAGWSMGGILAYEMAQQLTRAGEKVALLALIDSYPPALLRQLEAADGVGEGLSDADPASRWRQAFVQDLRAQAGTGAPIPGEQEAHLLRIFQAHSAAFESYRPESYDGPVTLFACAQPALREQVQAWGALAPRGLLLRELSGDHYSILQAPQVAQLAEYLVDSFGESGFFAK
ncbi:non-ribosomal peptide synthetase [Azonexus sp.]|uniref:non-ribosomal peptide synthetase n=1 Tax=Azonexus sp. TaxID=1872668 RepID=UPI0027B99CE5|nr:non-ribosomal peptide synthetase [Azonexus sp.]